MAEHLMLYSMLQQFSLQRSRMHGHHSDPVPGVFL